MNRTYQRKLRAYLVLIGLFTLVSCSLSFSSTKNTVFLRSMDSTMFESMFRNKYWGNKANIASSDICVQFREDNINHNLTRSGKITAKDKNGQYISVGDWTYTPTKRVFSFRNTAGLSARYDIINMSFIVIVEFQGRNLHLLTN